MKAELCFIRNAPLEAINAEPKSGADSSSLEGEGMPSPRHPAPGRVVTRRIVAWRGVAEFPRHLAGPTKSLVRTEPCGIFVSENCSPCNLAIQIDASC